MRSRAAARRWSRCSSWRLRNVTSSSRRSIMRAWARAQSPPGSSPRSLVGSAWASWPSSTTTKTLPSGVFSFGRVPRFIRERTASTVSPKASAASGTVSRRLVDRPGFDWSSPGRIGRQRRAWPRSKVGAGMHLYSAPQDVVLGPGLSRGANRQQPRSGCIGYHWAGYELPRISIIGFS